jgi:predicted transcriptional regulator YdeE
LAIVRAAIFLTLLAFAGSTWGGMTKAKIVDQKEFTVVGIAARTTNAQEAAGNSVIAKQWERFYKERVFDKVPNKADTVVYVVYCDYASDRNGEYTYIIGAKVSGVSEIPAGMVAKTVSAGKYAIVTSERGPIPKIIVEAWQKIWSLEDQSAIGGKRAYRTDFEVYDERARDAQDSQIDIHVGIK